MRLENVEVISAQPMAAAALQTIFRNPDGDVRAGRIGALVGHWCPLVANLPRLAVGPLDDIAADWPDDAEQPASDVVLLELGAADGHAKRGRRITVGVGVDHVSAANSDQRLSDT